MKQHLRIVHAGSILLGDPYTGLPLEKCKERYRRFSDVLDTFFEYLREEAIDLVLFSGNLCGRYLTSDDAKLLITRLSSFPDCTFVISPGEKDPFDSDSLYASGRLPKNAYIFENEMLDCFTFPSLGVRVYGWAIHGQRSNFAPLSGAVLGDRSMINLISGCCEITHRNLFAHVTLEDIAESSADYAAFSHGAATPVARVGNTLYCHAGFLEGRCFEETGEGGIVRVDITRDTEGEERRVDARFVPLYHHRYRSLTLDVTGATDMSDVLRAVRGLVEANGLGPETSLRVVLEGELNPTVMLRRTTDEARDLSLYSLELIDHTRPTLNADYLERDMTVRGELYRTLKERIASQNPQESYAVSQAFRAGLAALESRDITGI